MRKFELGDAFSNAKSPAAKTAKELLGVFAAWRLCVKTG